MLILRQIDTSQLEDLFAKCLHLFLVLGSDFNFSSIIMAMKSYIQPNIITACGITEYPGNNYTKFIKLQSQITPYR